MFKKFLKLISLLLILLILFIGYLSVFGIKTKSFNQLIEENRAEGKTHRKIYRPWGNYTSVVEGSRWQVKRIEVIPQAILS